MEKNNWKSPQALIISFLILLIFAYIVVDFSLIKPKIARDIKDVRNKYVELSAFLNKKIPEIDSTFKIQASQIKQQKAEMDTLRNTLK